MIQALAKLMKQNEKLLKKLDDIGTTIETMAESIDTLIQIETERIKKS